MPKQADAHGLLRRLVVLVTVLVVAIVPTVSSTGGATTPGRNGLIAFTNYRLQNSPLWSEIWVAIGWTGAHKVSRSPKPVEDDQARWSPDGRSIVFDRCTSSCPCAVWLVRPDGSGQRKLAPACPSTTQQTVCDSASASFTRDSLHVVFTLSWGRMKKTRLGDEIEHSAIAMTDPRSTPDDPAAARPVHGRPPGAAYLAERPAAGLRPLRLGLFTPGQRRRTLRRQAARRRPAPAHPVAGKRRQPGLVARRKDDPVQALHFRGRRAHPWHQPVHDRRGRPRVRRITNVGAAHYVLAGSFSPDGASIVFATDNDATLNPRGGTFADVFTMQLGTTLQHPVTDTANLDGWPSWVSRH